MEITDTGYHYVMINSGNGIIAAYGPFGTEREAWATKRELEDMGVTGAFEVHVMRRLLPKPMITEADL
jgi:hypothetical protein